MGVVDDDQGRLTRTAYRPDQGVHALRGFTVRDPLSATTHQPGGDLRSRRRTSDSGDLNGPPQPGDERLLGARNRIGYTAPRDRAGVGIGELGEQP